MSYLLLIVEPIGQREARGLEGGQQAYQRMLDYAESLKQRGVLRAVESLESEKRAVRLQVRDGRKAVIDGPYAEAKEMVGGIFVLDCKTREEALAYAAECPAVEWASVEVREAAPCFL